MRMAPPQRKCARKSKGGGGIMKKVKGKTETQKKKLEEEAERERLREEEPEEGRRHREEEGEERD
jgi:hypothetical protein